MRARLSLAVTLLVAALASAGAGAGCSFVSTGGMSGIIQPTIKPSSAAQGAQTIARDWEFEDRAVRLSVPIDSAVYEGAKTAEKRAIFIGDARDSDWVPDYYRAFVAERHQEAFYSAMLESLHAVRTREGLDDARYIELVTTMAQGIEYRTDPGDLAPKFPIETFGDGFGDCDDKALLAAALLSRDGYDVSILMFEPEKHVAMGVRAPGLDYKGTGYAYVELAGATIVGSVPEELVGGIRLTSQPQVVKIGEGTRGYPEGQQVAYIEQRFAELRAAEGRARARIESDGARLKSEDAALQAERRAFEAVADPVQRNAAIQEYNAHVKRANDFAAEANDRINRYNALVEIEKYVVAHSQNRPEVYRRLRGARL